MRARTIFLFAVMALLAMGPALPAQTTAPDKKPMVWGGFRTQGTATLGWRWTDVKGYRPMYRELFNLNQGPRIFDGNILGEAPAKSHLFADTWSLSVSGLGGDPFASAQLRVNKSQLYDLRVNWRQSYFYSNQNDLVALPIGTSATGLTNNHDWATVRKIGSAEFTVHASNNLRFNFAYYRTTNDGPTFLTRSLDFLNAPSYWASFARANAYVLYAPASVETNRFSGGVDYSLKNWSFHYTTGYQSFREDVTMSATGANELSINPIAASTHEPLTSLSWSQSRKLTTPLSEFSYNGKPSHHSPWELRGGYTFYRYRGPTSLTNAVQVTAPASNSTSTFVSQSYSNNANGEVSQSTHILDQGVTVRLAEWASLEADFRYTRSKTKSSGSYSSLFTGASTTAVAATVANSASVETEWTNGVSDLEIGLVFTPYRSLVIRPGVRLLRSDLRFDEDGVNEEVVTESSKTISPELRASWQPSSRFSIRGDVHTLNRGSSLTSITPHTEVGGRINVRFRPLQKVTIDNDTRLSSNKLQATAFENRVRSNATTVTYAPVERFTFFGGYSYDSVYAHGNILYARGTAPLSNTLNDQEVDRVIQGGLEATPVRRFDIRISGNYVRSTGSGTVSNEAPAYGPLRWPMITGSFSYDLLEAGKLAVDLQRSYYSEDIVKGNNFGANMLTVRWTRNF